MMIADQCRSLACKCFALSLDPLVPPARREELAVAAAWNERMADAMDSTSPLTASRADLRAMADAYGLTQ